MKILGIGVDIINNKRIRKSITNKALFVIDFLILLLLIISTPIPKIFIKILKFF